MRRQASLGLVGLLVVICAGCGMGQRPIPSGAQQLHVEVMTSGVRLNPATVHAGTVYVVLDTPNASYGFVSSSHGPGESGPLSNEDLARLAYGDDRGFEISGFGRDGCSAQEVTEGHGKMGPPCGNVLEMDLVEGRYAFYVGDLIPGEALSLAVLEVTP